MPIEELLLAISNFMSKVKYLAEIGESIETLEDELEVFLTECVNDPLLCNGLGIYNQFYCIAHPPSLSEIKEEKLKDLARILGPEFVVCSFLFGGSECQN